MPRPTLYDEDLRDALVEHTAQAIAASGVEAVSLRAVAHAAGTSTNAVYTLFGGRQELIGEVSRRADASFTAAQEEVTVTDDALDDLARLGIAYRRWALAHPALYTVMFSRVVPTPLDPQDLPPAAIRPLTRTVTRLVETGTFRDTPVGLVVGSIWAAVHGMVSLEILDHARHCHAGTPDLSAEDAYLHHLSAIARGWRA